MLQAHSWKDRVLRPAQANETPGQYLLAAFKHLFDTRLWQVVSGVIHCR